MKILFITLVSIESIEDRNIYSDLIRCFIKRNNHVTIISPIERKYKSKSVFKEFRDHTIIRPKSLNFQKVNAIEKVASILLIDSIIKRSVKRYCSNSSFDLVIYCTPPITITKTIQYVKEKYQAKTYLLLKDIFPQNAVDLNLIKKNTIIYNFFKKIESNLYNISDHIGCMSMRNIEYILANNKIDSDKLHLSPNSEELLSKDNLNIEKTFQSQNLSMRKKLNIPLQAKVLIYGGNLGKPQGIDFVIKLLNYYNNNSKVYILIIGSGTEYKRLLKWSKESNSKNIQIYSHLPKSQYEQYVKISDFGLIFLDHRFTIPNYPSRLLGYLQNKKPVLCFTDPSTDIGNIAKNNGYGDFAMSNDFDSSIKLIENYLSKNFSEIQQMGLNGYNYFLNNYTVEKSYSIIMERVNGNK